MNLGTFQGRRYVLKTTPVTWGAANYTARSLNGRLAIVRDTASNNWLRNAVTTVGAVNGPFWIGLNDAAVENSFRWTNSTPFSYENWEDDEPNNTGGNEDYVEVQIDSTWNDERRTATRPYVVEFGTPCNTPVQISTPLNGSTFPVGTTPVTYEAFDAAGNRTTKTFNVTVLPNPTPPVISPSGPATFCDGDSVILTSSSANGYLWSTGSTDQQITVTTPGTYSVTAVNGPGCAATSANFAVAVLAAPATPIITPAGPLTICAGDSIILTSSSAAGNVWSTGATSQSIIVKAPGTYSVSVTNVDGCSAASAAVNVTVITVPEPNIAAVPTLCSSGTPVELTATPLNGTWTGTGVNGASFDPQVAGPGSHVVVYTILQA
ncbi:MAG: HYR domain-containing protein, partial [Flavobacteriales bacterium]|nr:HYR domain-containing protein [Flavobacteriales bacterium]